MCMLLNLCSTKIYILAGSGIFQISNLAFYLCGHSTVITFARVSSDGRNHRDYTWNGERVSHQCTLAAYEARLHFAIVFPALSRDARRCIKGFESRPVWYIQSPERCKMQIELISPDALTSGAELSAVFKRAARALFNLERALDGE